MTLQSKREVRLSEWGSADPQSDPSLAGLSLDGHPAARETANRLSEWGVLGCTETRQGIKLESTSFVGSLELGPVRITVEPKLRGGALLSLMRFAFGLRDVRLFELSEARLGALSFQDLLIHQLLLEVEELVSRGLRREYIVREETLGSPRGRIDFPTLVRRGGLRQASIPCRFGERSLDHLPNQVLRAGLDLATALATDGILRTSAHRLAAKLSEQVSGIPLSRTTFHLLDVCRNRLTSSYEPALTLVRLLSQNLGATAEGESEASRLPGYLFDMNIFFERLVTKFLQKNLRGASVHPQYGLAGVFEYLADYNPRGRQAPRPRPDILITQQGHVAAVLDAKYRDLYAEPLPRDMLYQLTVYALSQESDRRAAILYPTLEEGAKEARIAVRDPLNRAKRGEVILRPIRLMELVGVLGQPLSPAVSRGRARLAQQMAFG